MYYESTCLDLINNLWNGAIKKRMRKMEVIRQHLSSADGITPLSSYSKNLASVPCGSWIEGSVVAIHHTVIPLRLTWICNPVRGRRGSEVGIHHYWTCSTESEGWSHWVNFARDELRRERLVNWSISMEYESGRWTQRGTVMKAWGQVLSACNLRLKRLRNLKKKNSDSKSKMRTSPPVVTPPNVSLCRLHVNDTVREITVRWISGRSKDLTYYELSLVGVGGAM